MELDRFGRRLGLELLLERHPVGATYLLHPIDIVRYFEFEFARAALPARPGRCLDVASPRLFSLFVARHHPASTIEIINPDTADATMTRSIAAALRLPNVDVRNVAVESLEPSPRLDCVWTLSVLEHVAGEGGDTAAVAALHALLNPGGELLVSLPVARSFRVERRGEDVYGTRPPEEDGQFFFQRVYDEQSIQRRILDAAPWQRVRIRWFGELTPGWYASYERRWLAEGLPYIVNDPRFIADHFREYPSWREMPGDGVCGIALQK